MSDDGTTPEPAGRRSGRAWSLLLATLLSGGLWGLIGWLVWLASRAARSP